MNIVIVMVVVVLILMLTVIVICMAIFIVMVMVMMTWHRMPIVFRTYTYFLDNVINISIALLWHR